MQLAQARQRVGNLEQGALGVVAQTTKKILGSRSQIDTVTAVAQRGSVVQAQNRAATGCQDACASLDQFGEHLGFHVPETFLAITLEETADVRAQALLDDLIHVYQGHAEPASKVAPDGGFTATGHADQGNYWQRVAPLGAVAFKLIACVTVVTRPEGEVMFIVITPAVVPTEKV